MSNVKCKWIKKKCKCGWPNTSPRLETCQSCGQGMRCDNWAVSGYALCSNHGGPVPSRNFYGRGNFVNGSGSSFGISRLASKYLKQIKDGRVLSNRAAIEIIDERVRQLVDRIDQNEAPERMQRLHDLWQEYKQALENNDTVGKVLAFGSMDSEFKKIYHDYKAWEQMFEALDYRRKMVEGEVKILKEIKAFISAEEAYQMNAKVLAAVMRVVGDDPQKLKQVQYEFARIVGESSDIISTDDWDDGGGSGEVGSPEGSSDVDSQKLLHTGDKERSDIEGQDRT